MKLKWKVCESPVGRYRSFEKRGWPQASYAGSENIAAVIYCDDAYDAKSVRSGKHAPLTVHVADYSMPSNKQTGAGFTWRKLKGTFATLQEAKDATEYIVNKHPEIHPKEVNQ